VSHELECRSELIAVFSLLADLLWRRRLFAGAVALIVVFTALIYELVQFPGDRRGLWSS